MPPETCCHFLPLAKAEAAMIKLQETPSLNQIKAEAELFSAEGKLASEEAVTLGRLAQACAVSKIRVTMPWSPSSAFHWAQISATHALQRSASVREQQQTLSATGTFATTDHPNPHVADGTGTQSARYQYPDRNHSAETLNTRSSAGA